MSIDALLRWFRLRGQGSWASFVDAVESFQQELDSRSLARGLSEHALVEFDFQHMRWSACGTTLVKVALPNGGYAVSGWGGSHEQIEDAGLMCINASRTIHTWSGDVTYLHASRVQHPSNGWPRTWEPMDAKALRRQMPSIDALAAGAQPIRTPRSGERFDFTFHALSAADDNRPTRWVEAFWDRRTAVDPNLPGLWRVRHGTYAFVENGVAKRVTFEVGAWLAFRHWLRFNGAEKALSYDSERKILYVSASPFLPIPYVRGLMLSGARESAVVADRVRVFNNVEPSLCGWFSDLLGIRPC